MIVGIGLDVIEIDRIEHAVKKRKTFSNRVLTQAEWAIFNELKGSRQIEFLAGRYAAKEAFSKAFGTGIGKLGFHDLEILPNEKGKPILTKSPFNGNVFLSITHTNTIAAAQVILEQNEE
ncbi:holo-ACP synthase [Carnobacterium funditum]|uniref:holo-ACP synthase n=1 Tax=Carnobacterium funditum TaxID=2752 RepID=UPI00054D71CD|nr:holo-ACP synthase [Carnobacterium funditum]